MTPQAHRPDRWPTNLVARLGASLDMELTPLGLAGYAIAAALLLAAGYVVLVVAIVAGSPA